MKILWASPNTLLDTSNGAAMMVRECLSQLALRGCEINILGGTVFVNPEGATGHSDLWIKLKNKQGSFVELQDGNLRHRLLVTQQTQRRLLYSYEEKIWFDEYCRLLDTVKPDLFLFFDNSLITLLTAHEARRRDISVGVFLMHGKNQGNEWCRDVNWIFTDTQATAKMYSEREGYEIFPIGTFVSPDKVKSPIKTRESLLFINPIPAKGSVLFIQLAIWLQKNRPDIKLEVVDTRKTWLIMLKQLSSAMGLNDLILKNTRITPNTLDMRPIYSRARLLFVPSVWWESGPRVIVEALSNGIPVIGSNLGGIPEVLGDGGEIFDIPKSYQEAPFTRLFPESFIESLAHKVSRYWDDNTFYEKASDLALKTHKNLHNIESNANNLKNLIQKLLEK